MILTFYFLKNGLERKLTKIDCSEFFNATNRSSKTLCHEQNFHTKITDLHGKDFWLGISDSDQEGIFKTDNGDILHHIFKNMASNEISINQYEWMNQLTNLSLNTTLNGVKISSVGTFEIENENRELDAVCIYNILPDDCSTCLYKDFCKYKDQSKNETECLCPFMTEGENCEIDECKCLNGGQCYTNDETRQVECLCPHPFNGKYCESGKIK